MKKLPIQMMLVKGRAKINGRPTTVLDWFLEKTFPEPNSGCWYWIGTQDKAGYGLVRFLGRHMHAQRASYLIFIGRIPSKCDVCHTCDEPSCVNPDHLWLGDARSNSKDMMKKGRDNVSKLNNEDINVIRDMRKQGASYYHIAKFYGVTKETIWSVCTKRTWNHVE